jgi:glutathione synthase/RimK-type ligase-like ATP-grasp enzyme
MPSPLIALLTDHRYLAETAAPDDWYLGNILQDDRLLQAALRARGVSSVRVDWADSTIDWSQFACAVFRTTWDYFDRRTEFAAWLPRVARQTRLCNPASLVAWNMDKHYLADLLSAGLPIVPTQFIECGDSRPLVEWLDSSGWDEAIVKPCVSGAARHTYRLARNNAVAVNDVDVVIRPLLADESFLLQPFQRRVLEQGEDTLMILDGHFTHAVRKLPKPGDFRVQDDHGGTLHACEPTGEQIDLALRAMAACSPTPAYGRVDMVRNARGEWVIMELELIEPELWLRRCPPAAERMADAIVRVVLDYERVYA